MRRAYPALLFGLFVVVSALGALLHFASPAWAEVRVFIACAAVCVAVAAIGWELVLANTRPREAPRRPEASTTLGDGEHAGDTEGDSGPSGLSGSPKPGTLAWVGFPVAVFAGLAALPFLVLSVAPEWSRPLSGQHISAHVVGRAEDAALRLSFPEDTTREGTNVRLNARGLAAGYVQANPAWIRWLDRRTIELPLARITRELGLERIDSIGVNQLRGLPPVAYTSGTTAPAQTVVVP